METDFGVIYEVQNVSLGRGMTTLWNGYTITDQSTRTPVDRTPRDAHGHLSLVVRDRDRPPCGRTDAEEEERLVEIQGGRHDRSDQAGLGGQVERRQGAGGEEGESEDHHA